MKMVVREVLMDVVEGTAKNEFLTEDKILWRRWEEEFHVNTTGVHHVKAEEVEGDNEESEMEVESYCTLKGVK